MNTPELLSFAVLRGKSGVVLLVDETYTSSLATLYVYARLANKRRGNAV